ncbi:MAG: methionyl-tRNA formyltransferase [Magnetococcales bacterium]|nr:methionyl-tRNA formyltransferase [Magnetococcales bacterium]
MSSWRIVFMGTPDFALPSLNALIDSTHSVVGVFTQPDRPTGRGMKLRPSPVKEVAMHHRIPTFQPQKLKDPSAIADCQALQPDLIVVVAYGQILPQAILAMPPQGCINVHASLLPRWRGAAPIHRALLAGDPETGITIMRMDQGLDTGPILSMESLSLSETITGGELHDALAQMGAALLLRTIEALKANRIRPTPQPDVGVIHAPKLVRADEKISFDQPARQVQRHILALNPWPGASALLENQPVKLLHARLNQEGSGSPGTILSLHDDGPEIACREGSVIVTELQPPGKRRMTAAEWLRGHPVQVGMCWE